MVHAPAPGGQRRMHPQQMGARKQNQDMKGFNSAGFAPPSHHQQLLRSPMGCRGGDAPSSSMAAMGRLKAWSPRGCSGEPTARTVSAAML